MRCEATTQRGEQCRNPTPRGQRNCERHRDPRFPPIPICDEYRVIRKDDKDRGVIVFVLDPEFDTHALVALKAYQQSLYKENNWSMDAHTLGAFVEMFESAPVLRRPNAQS